jgi:hypothetical protein
MPTYTAGPRMPEPCSLTLLRPVNENTATDIVGTRFDIHLIDFVDTSPRGGLNRHWAETDLIRTYVLRAV